MVVFDRQHVLGRDLRIDEDLAIGWATEALGVGVAGSGSGFEAANKKVVEAGIVAEGVFDFVEINAVALDEWEDLTPSPSALLPPAVEAGAKGSVEDGAKDKMSCARAVEPVEKGLSRNVLDDDILGLAVAVAGWHGVVARRGVTWDYLSPVKIDKSNNRSKVKSILYTIDNQFID